jgi:four helix bundle protein
MEPTRTASGRPFDIRERLLAAGTSIGANAEEADGASSRRDFIAKNSIALKEAKETRFRLRICRRCDLLDSMLKESDELIRIIAAIIHSAKRGNPD